MTTASQIHSPGDSDYENSDDDWIVDKKFSLKWDVTENTNLSKELDKLQATAKGHNALSTLDDVISSVRKKRKCIEMNEYDLDEDTMENDNPEVELLDYSLKNDTTKDKLVEKKNPSKRKKAKNGFFEEILPSNFKSNFLEMNLSRPLIKALTAMQLTKPTRIQSATIPVALQGRDVCACAATGSGKTLAFLLPILERLLYKPPDMARVTRVLILTPTRELAIQICQVTKQLLQFVKGIDVCIAAGGLDLKTQEAALRLNPDIVIGTPGRLIDHLHNTPSFALNTVEILILDEADRMLDEFFAEQMNEVIRLCSRNRQTMLFSATMSDQVKDLVAVSLVNPVKIFMDENYQVAPHIQQEFVRIKPKREGDREAIAIALLHRVCPRNTIMFLQTKKLCHRFHVLLGLLGFKVGELHGNVPQSQRLKTLKKFKDKEIDILLATDLAARGLDISGIETVINFTMPNSLRHYIHRVGRTARAGCQGRSISMCGEDERKLLKQIIRSSKTPVMRRTIKQDVISNIQMKIEDLQNEVDEVLRLEKEEKLLNDTEKQIDKATCLLQNDSGKNVEQNRVWFQDDAQRKLSIKRQNLTEHSGKKKLTKAKKQKVFGKSNTLKLDTPEERVKKEVEKAIRFSARTAKKETSGVQSESDTLTKIQSKKKKVSSFEKELCGYSKMPFDIPRKKGLMVNKNRRGRRNKRQKNR